MNRAAPKCHQHDSDHDEPSESPIHKPGAPSRYENTAGPRAAGRSASTRRSDKSWACAYRRLRATRLLPPLESVEELKNAAMRSSRAPAAMICASGVNSRARNSGIASSATAAHDITAAPSASAIHPERSPARDPSPERLPDPDRRGRADAKRDHEGRADGGERDLVPGQRRRIQPSYQHSDHREDADFHRHLSRRRQSDAKQFADSDEVGPPVFRDRPAKAAPSFRHRTTPSTAAM